MTIDAYRWEEPADALGQETGEAIDLLWAAGHWSQALMLLFVGIDNLGWLHAPPSAKKVDDETFMAWVDQYMSPAELGCTSRDLYGARCGLLHQRVSGSERSRRKQARDLLYMISPTHRLEALRARRASEKQVVIDAPRLVAAFKEGARRFHSDLANDRARWDRARSRSHEWLRKHRNGEVAFPRGPRPEPK